MRHKALIFCLVSVWTSQLRAQSRPIDTQRSTITIRVGKSGLLSAAAHDHTINAPIASGMLDENEPHVEFTVETGKMTVQPNPRIDAKTQATIQKDMDEMTLDVREFPEIRFRSTRAEKIPNGEWKVEGNLTLHGTTRPVSLTVKQMGDTFTTHAVLKQTDYGIKPISIGGGMIKVKNEVEIDFHIVAPGSFGSVR